MLNCPLQPHKYSEDVFSISCLVLFDDVNSLLLLNVLPVFMNYLI